VNVYCIDVVATRLENLKNLKKSRKEFKTGEGKRQGKCVLACGQLP